MKKITQEKLDEIVQLHEKWLGDHSRGSKADLSGLDLSDLNMHAVDLSYADLSNSNLTNVNLSCSMLYYTNLSNTNLTRCNLLDTNLYKANLDNAMLKETKIGLTDI